MPSITLLPKESNTKKANNIVKNLIPNYKIEDIEDVDDFDIISRLTNDE